MTGVDSQTPEARSSRRLGLVALLLSLVAFIISLIGTVVRLRSLYSESSSPISGINSFNYVELALAIVAIVLGAIAWNRRGPGSGAGAVAVGVGVAMASPVLVNLIALAALRV